MIFLEKAKNAKNEYERLTAMLSDPSVIANNELFQKTAKQHADLAETAEKYDNYIKLQNIKQEAQFLLENEKDPEMQEMARQEIYETDKKLSLLEEELKILITPKDPDDSKNAIVEIRAGTGGEEAGLFAADLFRMYTKFAEKNKFKIEVVDSSPTELGGFKEIIFFVNGSGAYGKFKFESGTHRVQRVPATEASGRVHTSAATVAVLPEQEESEFKLKSEELRIEVCRASGAGGQHVNKTESAVRIVHIPTGIEVYCQDGRSQIKNKEKAMKIIAARVKEKQEREEKAKLDSQRKSQIGTGDRSEKIRTYNYPQNRITDHRIGYTSYNLETVMEGELDEFIVRLSQKYIENAMKGGIMTVNTDDKEE